MCVCVCVCVCVLSVWLTHRFSYWNKVCTICTGAVASKVTVINTEQWHLKTVKQSLCLYPLLFTWDPVWDLNLDSEDIFARKAQNIFSHLPPVVSISANSSANSRDWCDPTCWRSPLTFKLSRVVNRTSFYRRFDFKVHEFISWRLMSSRSSSDSVMVSQIQGAGLWEATEGSWSWLICFVSLFILFISFIIMLWSACWNILATMTLHPPLYLLNILFLLCQSDSIR